MRQGVVFHNLSYLQTVCLNLSRFNVSPFMLELLYIYSLLIPVGVPSLSFNFFS